MKTFKVTLKDFYTESISAENYAVDDHNNLIVGNTMFHKDVWKQITFLYDNAVSATDYYGLDQPVAHDPYSFEPLYTQTGSINPNYGAEQGVAASEYPY